MKESAFKNALHKHVDKAVFRQSMTGASMTGNGILDHYYDGTKADLWIEYKVADSMKQSSVAPIPNRKKQPRGRCSPLQARWAERRYANGQNAFVLLMCPDKAVYAFRGNRLDVPHVVYANFKEAAKWINAFCI